MLYVDTSALVKLVRIEAETVQLRSTLTGHALGSCQLILTELHRAVARYADVEGRARVDDLLESVELVALDRSLLTLAGRLPPPRLRSLDAIHLAAVTILGEQMRAIVTYDLRMAAAARGHGFEVWSPGVQS